MLTNSKERIDRACPYCDKFFKYSTNYDAHVLKHSDPKPYKCHMCSNAYATKQAFVLHLQVHNSGGSQFEACTPQL